MLGTEEVAIYKPRWGAFYQTPLEEYLREREVSTLVFSGCNFPNCPHTSIYEASERTFGVVLAEDAISGLYDRGKQELRTSCCPRNRSSRRWLLRDAALPMEATSRSASRPSPRPA
jgi:isochorismate hydrolase